MRKLLELTLIGCFVAVVALLVHVSLRLGYTEMIALHAEEPPQLTLAQYHSPENGDVARKLGILARAEMPPRHDEARRLFARAARNQPYESLNWSEWASAAERTGDPERARALYEMALSLDPNNHEILQDYGSFLVQRGEIETAAEQFRLAIAQEPTIAPAYYSLLWNFGWSPTRTAELLPPDDKIIHGNHFRDASVWAPVEQVEELWSRHKSNADWIDQSMQSNYLLYLIRRGYQERAEEEWRAIVQDLYQISQPRPRDELFFNGDLHYNIVFEELGLDWAQLGEIPEGVSVNLFDSVQVEYHGTHNLSFYHVRHFILPRPGKTYELSWRARAKSITTDEGPCVAVHVFRDDEVVWYHFSDPMIGNASGNYSTQFTMPEEGRFAVVSIRRRPSKKLNNKISGHAEFDDFRLRELAPEEADTEVEDAAL